MSTNRRVLAICIVFPSVESLATAAKIAAGLALAFRIGT